MCFWFTACSASFFQQIRPWAARNHRSGSTSLLLLVTSSVLMVKEWSAKWRDLSNHTRRGTIQSRTTEKKAKNRVTLTWKFPWKSCSTAHLPFLSSNPKILKPSLKTFPPKWSLLNTQQKKKKWAKKSEKRGEESAVISMEWTAYSLVFKLINLHSPRVVYESSRNHN